MLKNGFIGNLNGLYYSPHFPQPTEEQIEMLRHTFHKHDENHDGVLSIEEFQGLVTELNDSLPEPFVANLFEECLELSDTLRENLKQQEAKGGEEKGEQAEEPEGKEEGEEGEGGIQAVDDDGQDENVEGEAGEPEETEEEQDVIYPDAFVVVMQRNGLVQVSVMQQENPWLVYNATSCHSCCEKMELYWLAA